MNKHFKSYLKYLFNAETYFSNIVTCFFVKNIANLAFVILTYKAVLHRSKILDCNPFIRDDFVVLPMPNFFCFFFFSFILKGVSQE